MKHAPEITGFDFQEIPMEEALNVVLAGDGNYAELKQTLLEKLPKLAPDKAFVFGLPNNKEVPEDQRRVLCKAINSTMKKAKMNWRVTYSAAKKVFVCVPFMKSEASKVYTPRSKWNGFDNTPILELWNKGMSVNKIVATLGENVERVKYVCYHKNPRTGRETPAGNGNVSIEDEKAKKEVEALINLSMRLFKVTREDIADGNHPARAARKAICVIGVEHKIPKRVIAPYLGISEGGVHFTATHHSNVGKDEIVRLRKAYGGK